MQDLRWQGHHGRPLKSTAPQELASMEGPRALGGAARRDCRATATKMKIRASVEKRSPSLQVRRGGDYPDVSEACKDVFGPVDTPHRFVMGRPGVGSRN